MRKLVILCLLVLGFIISGVIVWGFYHKEAKSSNTVFKGVSITLDQQRLDDGTVSKKYDFSLEVPDSMEIVYDDENTRAVLKEHGLELDLYTFPEGESVQYEQKSKYEKIQLDNYTKELFRVAVETESGDDSLGYYYTDHYSEDKAECGDAIACGISWATFSDDQGKDVPLNINCVVDDRNDVAICDKVVQSLKLTKVTDLEKY